MWDRLGGMNVTLKIFYSDNVYAPACYFGDWRACWQLWFTLTHSMSKGVSGPYVQRVEIWDGGVKLEPDKGVACSLGQQYTGS